MTGNTRKAALTITTIASSTSTTIGSSDALNTWYWTTVCFVSFHFYKPGDDHLHCTDEETETRKS